MTNCLLCLLVFVIFVATNLKLASGVCRVLGALLVIASLFLNVTLILVSNNEISMSFWEWLWN